VDHHFFSFRNYAGARDKTKNSKAAGTSVSSCLRALGVTGVNFQQGVKWDVGQEESTTTVRSTCDYLQRGKMTRARVVCLL